MSLCADVRAHRPGPHSQSSQGHIPVQSIMFDPIVYPGRATNFANHPLASHSTAEPGPISSVKPANVPQIASGTIPMNLSTSPDPMRRWIGQGRDEPWSTSRSTAHSIRGYSGSSFSSMRNPAASDTESVITSATPATAYSTYSDDVGSTSQEPLPIQGDFAGLGMLASPRGSRASSLLEVPKTSPTLKPTGLVCHRCGVEMRTPSEFKKHRLKHEKPFKCPMHGCERSLEGFTTVNDLERHKKSKHKILPSSGEVKIYKCASLACVDKIKVWYRLDNFGQHLDRMHGDQDRDDLVKRSEFVMHAEDEPSTSQLQTILDDNSDTPDLASQDPYGLKLIGQWYGPNDPHVGDGSHLVHYDAQGSQQMFNTPAFRESSNTLTTFVDSFPVSAPKQWSRSFHSPDADAGQTPFTAPVSTRALDSGANPKTGVVLHQGTGPRPRQEELELISLAQHGYDLKALADAIYRNLHGPSIMTVSGAANRTVQGQGARTGGSVLMDYSGDNRSRQGDREDGSSSSTQSQSVESGTPRLTAPVERGYRCEFCPKVLARQSALKKHQKRHERLYGCTFSTCNKTFGSKDDWKRHENSQHFQVDTWRCEQPSKLTGFEGLAGSECAKLFHRKEIFAEHLKRTHSITDKTTIVDECKKRYIGGNYQTAFWCGFCRKIQSLNNCGPKAWDERFNHIGDHFSNEEKRIKDWLPENGDKIKGQLLEDRYSVPKQCQSAPLEDEDDDEGLDEAELDYRGPSPPPAPSTQSHYRVDIPEASIDPNILAYEQPPCQPSRSHSKRRRPEQVSMSAHPAELFDFDSPAKTFYCCQCSMGPFTQNLQVMCGEYRNGCSHEFCDRCRRGPNKRQRSTKGSFAGYNA